MDQRLDRKVLAKGLRSEPFEMLKAAELLCGVIVSVRRLQYRVLLLLLLAAFSTAAPETRRAPLPVGLKSVAGK